MKRQPKFQSEVWTRAFTDVLNQKYVEAAPTEPVCFPPEMERRINRLIAAERNHQKPFGHPAFRRVVTVALIAAVIAASALSVEAVRTPVVEFFHQVYEVCTHFFVRRSDSEAPAPRTIETVYTFDFVPDGYTQTLVEVAAGGSRMKWEDGTGNKLSLSQYLLNRGYLVNTEGCEQQEVTVRGRTAMLYRRADVAYLVWATEDYSFMLISSGNPLPDETLLRLASGLVADPDALRSSEGG